MTDAFSQRRLELLEDFVNLEQQGNTQAISATWSRHYHSLQGSRGLFVVTDPRHEKAIPGDKDFGNSGFLRCWLASTRLLLLQNRDDAREFRYNAPIYCDTNFASFCEAFDAGRSLGAHQNGFESAVAYLLPIANGTNIFPYLIENAENPNMEKVRATLRAFAAFKLTSAEFFAAEGRFTHHGKLYSSDQFADGCLAVMAGQDFKTIRAWVRKYFLWARIILLKCTLLAFKRPMLTLERRFHALIQFLHEELARLPQFEIHVGYRFFALDSGASFFHRVQQNARTLDRTLNAMAWDMAHWRGLFDMLLIDSSAEGHASFPIPHFLTFDQPFVRLTEGLRLAGLIYSPVRRRHEQIPNAALARSVSELLHGSCVEFYKPHSREDRARRALDGERLEKKLSDLESQLVRELDSVRTDPANC